MALIPDGNRRQGRHHASKDRSDKNTCDLTFVEINIETGQQCLLLTNTLSRYHITPTQTKPPGHEECNGMEGVVILVFRVVIAK